MKKKRKMNERGGSVTPKPPVTRRAGMKDADRIIELLSKLGRPEPRNELNKNQFAKLIQTYISEKDKTILVAEADSRVVGIVSLVILPRLNRTTPEAWIPDFIVDQEYRNRGIGKDLLKECISIARRKNCWRIRLETGLSRKEAQRFYLRMQMKPFALAFTLPL
jgi:GNAT superfamily N-acetyltransferase